MRDEMAEGGGRDERQELAPPWWQGWTAGDGLWSDAGYGGLSLVFDVPLEGVNALAEAEKRALVRLFIRLKDTPGDQVPDQVKQLGALSPAERLAALLKLATASPAE